jgi:hypothetical protein
MTGWALHLAQCQPIVKVMDQSDFEFKVEVEASGIKEENAKSSSSSGSEKPARPQDLPDRRRSEELMVEEAVTAAPPSPHPMMIVKILVKDMVREHLLDYYARDAHDRKHKEDGRVKDIKIRNEKEVMCYCNSFSRQKFLELTIAINGSDAGIEIVDVQLLDMKICMYYRICFFPELNIGYLIQCLVTTK